MIPTLLGDYKGKSVTSSEWSYRQTPLETSVIPTDLGQRFWGKIVLPGFHPSLPPPDWMHMPIISGQLLGWQSTNKMKSHQRSCCCSDCCYCSSNASLPPFKWSLFWNTRISSANGIATRRSTTKAMPTDLPRRGQRRQARGSGSLMVTADWLIWLTRDFL